jgi:hypothetical protein
MEWKRILNLCSKTFEAIDWTHNNAIVFTRFQCHFTIFSKNANGKTTTGQMHAQMYFKLVVWPITITWAVAMSPKPCKNNDHVVRCEHCLVWV